jgi:hypothetical protein
MYEYGVETMFDDRHIIALPPSQQVSASMRLSAGEQMIQVRAFDAFGAASDPWVSSTISVVEMSISSLAGNSTLLSSDVEAAAAALRLAIDAPRARSTRRDADELPRGAAARRGLDRRHAPATIRALPQPRYC